MGFERQVINKFIGVFINFSLKQNHLLGQIKTKYLVESLLPQLFSPYLCIKNKEHKERTTKLKKTNVSFV